MLRTIFLLTVLMSSVAFAQNANISTPEASKIDEFGPLTHCDMSSRLDNFLVELMNKPNAKGYIIFYEGKDALPSQLESSRGEILYMDYIKMRRFDANRITLLTSYRDEIATELWIVPENAAPPTPTDTIPKPQIPLDKTLLYDLGSIDSYNDFENYIDLVLPHKKAEYDQFTKTDEETSEEITSEPDVEEQKLSPEELEELKFNWTSDRFGAFLEKNKKMKGVIMFYADEQEFDINKVTIHIEEGKQRIVKSAKIKPERIQVIFGGYRSYIEIEFWTVPEKGKLPEPKPDERIVETETEVEDQ